MIDASVKAAAAYESSKPEYRDRFGKVLKDPRPDIDGDSQLWVTLFVEAERNTPKLADALFGFRCVGARLVQTDSGYVLRPHIDESGNCGFRDWAEYREQTDKWLKPYRLSMKNLLANLEAARKHWWGEMPPKKETTAIAAAM